MFSTIWSVLCDIAISAFWNRNNNKDKQQMETVFEQIQECNNSINTLKWIVSVLALTVFALLCIVLILYFQ